MSPKSGNKKKLTNEMENVDDKNSNFLEKRKPWGDLLTCRKNEINIRQARESKRSVMIMLVMKNDDGYAFGIIIVN